MQKNYYKTKQSGTPKPKGIVLQAIALGLMLLLLNACGAGSNVPDSYNAGNGLSGARQPGSDTEAVTNPGTGVVPQAGGWTASQMNFSVSSDGTLVESFEVTYAGRATNDRCDFDYSDLAMVNDLVIQDGVFTYDSDTLVIEGRFTAPQEAEVTVLWFGYYGGACQVSYNGDLMGVATADAAVLAD